MVSCAWAKIYVYDVFTRGSGSASPLLDIQVACMTCDENLTCDVCTTVSSGGQQRSHIKFLVLLQQHAPLLRHWGKIESQRHSTSTACRIVTKGFVQRRPPQVHSPRKCSVMGKPQNLQVRVKLGISQSAHDAFELTRRSRESARRAASQTG